MEIYKVGGLEFKSRDEAELAQKELDLINKIISENDIKDPVVAKKVYNKYAFNKTFKTKLGRQFLSRLQNIGSIRNLNNPTKLAKLYRVFYVIWTIIALGALLTRIPNISKVINFQFISIFVIVCTPYLMFTFLLRRYTNKMKNLKAIICISIINIFSNLLSLVLLHIINSNLEKLASNINLRYFITQITITIFVVVVLKFIFEEEKNKNIDLSKTQIEVESTEERLN